MISGEDDSRRQNEAASVDERQRRNLETLGLLGSQIAHDFNNVLMLIEGYTRLLLEEEGISPAVRENAEEILGAVNKGADLTQRLLRFGRKPSGGRQVLRWRPVYEKLRPLLVRLLGDSIRLEWAETGGDGAILAEPDQAEQVLLNLVLNSRDAMPLGGVIRLRSQTGEGYVQLEVADTGTGIAPESLNRVFEPFFTTKAEGKGTGLGLALVRECAEQWGGSVGVESELGQGTTIRFRLPVHGAPNDRPARILLVEDEAGLRGLMRRALVQQGYEVEEAGDFAGALRAADAADGIALLICDVELGATSGLQLAEQLAVKLPDLRCLFISGYPLDDTFATGAMAQFEGRRRHYLQKPFSPNTLVLEVRAVLAGQ